MQIPDYINVNGKKYLYRECNIYQQSIFKMVVYVMSELSALKQNPDEKTTHYHEKTGVLKFLVERFQVYGNLKEVKDSIYEEVCKDSCGSEGPGGKGHLSSVGAGAPG